MLESFKAFFLERFHFQHDSKILVAVSGGADSVCLCALLQRCGFRFDIIHCNFQLRGADSDEDERFVQHIAENYKVKFWIRRFDTKAYCEQHRMGIQEGARKLRYKFFEEVGENYDFIATAHHADDNVETFLMYLHRKAGIAGLKGIPLQRGKFIRPLWKFQKSEILDFLKTEGLSYREDISNSKTDYRRNLIRLQVLPEIKKHLPNFVENAVESMDLIAQQEEIYLKEIERFKQDVWNPETWQINIEKLQSYNAVYLFEILKQFGFHFKTVQLIFNQIDCQSGKIFYNAHYRIIKDRTTLIIDELKKNEPVEIEFNTLEELLNYFPESCIESYTTGDSFEKSGYFAYFDADSLKFPLILRAWRNGDKIRPFGMKGQKKLSDFFNDNKLNLRQKENILVLCHAQEVLWILGYRSSQTFAVTSETKYRVCLKNVIQNPIL